ncbi:MAG: hypothetical protein IJU63_08335 [Bacteroidales bacterium]|nr:hypothetical protein [Bacteroidales bacterium]
MLRTLRWVMPLAALLLAAACSRPDTWEQFIRTADAPGGVYAFEMDLSDSTALYDFTFYLRNDKTSLWTRAEDCSVPLDIVWTAPSGESWSERVYLRSGDERGRVEPYRRDCMMAESGTWTLQVTPRDTDRGFRGLGIICHRHGTR